MAASREARLSIPTDVLGSRAPRPLRRTIASRVLERLQVHNTGLDLSFDPGACPLRYDALRSSSPGDFTGAACLVSGSTEAGAVDHDVAAPGTGFYLVRAINDCPAGQGVLGDTSSGHPTPGRTCP